MELRITESDATTFVHVEAERIDAMVAIKFKDQVRDATLDAAETVILDLSRVNFLDSSGLGAVVAVMKQLGAERRLELAGLTPNVAKAFRLTRLDRIFQIHASVEEALRAVAPQD